MSLFFILVLPMILIVVLGMTYGGMSTARVGLADEDGGPLAADLATGIGQAGTPSTCGDSRPPGSSATPSSAAVVEVGLLIRPGYDAALRSGGTGRVEYVAQPKSYATAIRTALDAQSPARPRSSGLLVSPPRPTVSASTTR